jgi:hypothetical protein
MHTPFWGHIVELSRDEVVMDNRSAVLLVPAAGLMFLVGCLVRGAYILASPATAQSFALWTTRPSFTVGYFVLIAAATTSVFGYRALALHVGMRGSRVAMVASIVGVQFLLALFGAAVVVQSALGRAYLAGDTTAITTASAAFSGGALVGIAAMTVFNVLGHLLFAVRIWRTPGLSKVSAVLFVLAPIGMLMPFLYPVELLGCTLYLVAGALLAAAVGRSPPRSTARSNE